MDLTYVSDYMEMISSRFSKTYVNVTDESDNTQVKSHGFN